VSVIHFFSFSHFIHFLLREKETSKKFPGRRNVFIGMEKEKHSSSVSLSSPSLGGLAQGDSLKLMSIFPKSETPCLLDSQLVSRDGEEGRTEARIRLIDFCRIQSKDHLRLLSLGLPTTVPRNGSFMSHSHQEGLDRIRLDPKASFPTTTRQRADDTCRP